MADRISVMLKDDKRDEYISRDECLDFSDIVIRNQLVPHNSESFSPTGSPTVPTYGLHYENGRESLKVTGESDLYSKIQASHEDTKIYNILKRYSNGDISVLSRSAGQFFDATQMPSSLAEAQHHLMNVSKHFDSLPDSVKKEFNYSVTEYVEKIANGGVTYVNQLLDSQISGGSKSDMLKDVELPKSSIDDSKGEVK